MLWDQSGTGTELSHPRSLPSNLNALACPGVASKVNSNTGQQREVTQQKGLEGG